MGEKTKNKDSKKIKSFKVKKIDSVGGFETKTILDNKKMPQWLWGIFLLLVLVIVAEIGYLFYIFNQKKNPEERIVWENQEVIEVEEFYGYPRSIDGVFVQDEENANLWPAGVMIDNMINARPAFGISKANLVIESITEADITRFLAFFDLGQEIKKIGPVRSARPYFAEWASELGAFYAHSGGSPEALKNIKNGVYDIYDINEFYNGNDFWREANRQAPHNLFTSSELLKDIVDRKIGETEANYSKFAFKDENEAEGRGDDGQEIKIYFNNYNHLVKWVYDRESNDYVRYQMKKKHLEADGSEIRAKNIAVQYVSMEVLDYVGRKRIHTVGSKPAIVFQDGRVIESTWEKQNSESRTKFYLPPSSVSSAIPEIEFNRGVTWIEIVPTGVEVSY